MPVLSDQPNVLLPGSLTSKLILGGLLSLFVLGVFVTRRRRNASRASNATSLPSSPSSPSNVFSSQLTRNTPEKVAISNPNLTSTAQSEKENAENEKYKTESIPEPGAQSRFPPHHQGSGSWEGARRNVNKNVNFNNATNPNATLPLQLKTPSSVPMSLPSPTISPQEFQFDLTSQSFGTNSNLNFDFEGMNINGGSPPIILASSPISFSADGTLPPPRRRSYTKPILSGGEMNGEIIVAPEGWRRHTRVFGGGVCKACEESERRMTA